MGKKSLPSMRNVDASWGNSCWRLGDTGCTFDEPSMTLLRDGAPVAIETKPLFLLMLLLRHPRKLVRKELLVRTLWGGREVSDAVVAQVISKLRRALVQEDLLRTLHGLGYCLDLTPTRMDEVAMPDLQAVGAEPLRRRRTLRHTEVSK